MIYIVSQYPGLALTPGLQLFECCLLKHIDYNNLTLKGEFQSNLYSEEQSLGLLIRELE